MAVEDVGARLVLTGRTEFVAGMDEAAASTREFQKALSGVARTSLNLDRRLASLQATTAATKDVTKATTDAIGVEDAAAAASGRRTGASRVEQQAIRDTTKAAEDHVSKLEQLAKNPIIAKGALFGGGALAVGAYEAVKQYTNFNKLVTQSAVDAGVKVGNLKEVQKSLIDLSGQYGVTLNDAANTWYRIASSAAGTHATMKQMKEYTKDALKLDVLFNIPKGAQTEATSRIMGAMMNANLPGAETPAKIMALMNAGVGHGDIRGADMVSALGKATSAASFTGVRAVDVVSWIDTLTKLGMNGSQAGTLINHSMQQLTTGSSEQAQKALLSVGIDPGQMSKITTTQGLPAAINFLMSTIKKGGNTAGSYFPSYNGNAMGQASASAQQDAWLLADPKTMADWRSGKGVSDSEAHTILAGFLSKMFGAAKSASPLLALASDPQKLADLTASIQKAASPEALKQSMQTAMNTPGRQMDIARQNVTNAFVTAGQELTPMAATGMNVLKDIASYFVSHKDALVAVMGAIGSFVIIAGGVAVADRIRKAVGYVGDLFGILGNAGSAGSSVLAKVTGGALGTAKTVAGLAPEEIFAGAVTEFAAAVQEFAAGSALGGGGVPGVVKTVVSTLLPTAGGAVAGTAGGAVAGTVGGVAAADALGTGTTLAAVGTSGAEVAGATMGASFLVAAAPFLAGLAVFVQGEAAKADAWKHPSIGPDGKNYYSAQALAFYQANGSFPDQPKPAPVPLGPNGLPASNTQTNPGGWSPSLRGFAPLPGNNMGLLGDNYRDPGLNPNAPSPVNWANGVNTGFMWQSSVPGVNRLYQNLAYSAAGYMPNSTNQARGSTEMASTQTWAANQGFAGASNQLGLAKGDLAAAAKDHKDAAKETGKAAQKSSDAAKKHEDSAAKHTLAAEQLFTASQAVAKAATALGSTTIKATISAADILSVMALQPQPKT